MACDIAQPDLSQIAIATDAVTSAHLAMVAAVSVDLDFRGPVTNML